MADRTGGRRHSVEEFECKRDDGMCDGVSSGLGLETASVVNVGATCEGVEYKGNSCSGSVTASVHKAVIDGIESTGDVKGNTDGNTCSDIDSGSGSTAVYKDSSEGIGDRENGLKVIEMDLASDKQFAELRHAKVMVKLRSQILISWKQAEECRQTDGWKPKVRLRVWRLGPGLVAHCQSHRGMGWDVGKEWEPGQKRRACENGGVGKERGIGRENGKGLRLKSPNLEGLGCGNIWDREFPPSLRFREGFRGEMRGGS
jgi:hypothetical protein